MKHLTFLVSLLMSCSPGRGRTSDYQPADTTPDKAFLTKTIEIYKKKGFNYERPSLVIDGMLIEGEALRSIRLKLRKCELKQIHFLSPITAKNLYRELGEGGVILISTKKCEDKTPLKIEDSLDYKGS